MEENSEMPLTKKEKEALAREIRAEERLKSTHRGTTKKVIGYLLAAFLIGFLGLKTYKSLTAPVPEGARITMPVLDSDRILGKKDAKVTLIEFGDFQCPACAAYFPILKDLEKNHPNDLMVIYRNFPLTQIHKNAILAAKAAEAAGRQGKFWEMHDLLFETQTEWSEVDNAKDKFQGYAKEIGLDEAKWLSDLDSKEVSDKINSDVVLAQALGVDSTPTFYLNGKKTNLGRPETFRNLVEAEIKAVSN